MAAEIPHLVLVPFAALGHITPMLRLAKLLHARGFYITFVNTEFSHRRLLRSGDQDSIENIPGFNFETIPDGLPASDEDATQDVPTLWCAMIRTCLGPFRYLLLRLNSAADEPPVSCVISDGVISFSIRAARELGVPVVQFWTSSPCSFIGFLHYGEFADRGIVPFKNENFLVDGTLDAPVDWINGLTIVRLKDIPSFIRTTDPDDILFNSAREESMNNLKADAIIFNTFHEFDKEAMDAVITKFNFPNVYTIGPLHLLEKQLPKSKLTSLNPSFWKPDSKVLNWLDEQKPGSVVYVNYGSITTMSAQDLQEFAWGLANSKSPFLWIIRPDEVKGESAVLAEEFLREIKGRGLLVSWCEQEQVLAHKAVGVFLTHCGWNSTMETVSEGVPVICWPFFADQQTTCRYLCVNWKVGVEVNSDVKRNEVEELVREMMDGVKGSELRKRAKEWQKMAEEAVNVGGSSYLNFNELVNELLHRQD